MTSNDDVKSAGMELLRLIKVAYLLYVLSYRQLYKRVVFNVRVI